MMKVCLKNLTALSHNPFTRTGIFLISLFMLAAGCPKCANAFLGMKLSEIRHELQIRDRFEIWNGYNKKAYGNESINPSGKKQGDSDDKFILQRAIFGFSWEGESWGWCIDMYDSRAWGTSLKEQDFIKNSGTDQKHTMDPYREYFEPYELYVSFKGIGTPESRLILGRQIIGYGDNRIFGPGATTNSVGWLWDAARYSLKKDRNYLDLWYGQTKTQDPESLSLFSRHAFQGVGIYGEWHYGNLICLNPFFTWKRGLYYNKNQRENSYYLGARAVRNRENGIVYDITISKKLGRFIERDGPDPNINAQAYVCKLGWYFKKMRFSPKIMIGRVYASGDPDPENGDVRTFTRPFGTTDGGHYGIMDLMSWSNMVDNQVDFRFSPLEGYRLRIGFHDFHLDKKADKWAYFGYRIDNNRHDHIGNELDIILKCNPLKWLKVMAFYGHFWAGDFIRKNDIAHNDADRMVLQLTLNF